jgi:tetratricopeptide (TPR) repeat protein
MFSRLDPQEPIGWIYLNLVLLVVFQACSIIPHELGHAIVARLVGFRVFHVIVGRGRSSFKKRIAGTMLEFRPLPIGGATVVGPRTLEFLRLKLFLFALAGPFVNVLLILASVLLARPNGLALGKCLTAVLPLEDFAFANGLLLFFNLLPRMVNTPAGIVDSDGLMLLNAFVLSPERCEEILAATYSLEGRACLEEQKNAEALAWYDKGLQEHPRSAILRNDRAVALFDLGQFDQARESFLDLLRDPGLKPAVRAFALSNVAAADSHLLQTRRDLLEEAARHSEEAIRMLGWVPAIQGTRALVLIELGQVDEGLILARKAFETNETARSRAFNACTLAFGLHAKGKADEARKYLDIARGLNAKCSLLPRVENTLGQRSDSTS